MPTLQDILITIQGIVEDPVAYSDTRLTSRVNRALQSIAAGILMPNRGKLTPPLPELFTFDTVATGEGKASAYLPDDYQRNVTQVHGESWEGVRPPRGGDFHSFALFHQQTENPSMDEVGPVRVAAVFGRKLFYQGIPATPETLTVWYHRKPATLSMSTLNGEPEGLPEHLAEPLLTHFVCAEIFGEGIEDGENSQGTGRAYHQGKFLEFMEELARFAPESTVPFNVGEEGYVRY